MRMKPSFSSGNSDSIRQFLLFLVVVVALIPLQGQEEVSRYSFKGTVLGPKIWYFPIDRFELLSDYRDNASMFVALDSLLSDKRVREIIDVIHITSAASPIARADYNRNLSQKRAEALRDYITRNYDAQHIRFNISAQGVDWEGFRTIMEHEKNFPSRKEIFQLTDSQRDENGKLWLLRNIGGKEVQEKLIREIYPLLQYVSIRIRLTDGTYIHKDSGSPLTQLLVGRDYNKLIPIIGRDTVYIHQYHNDTVYMDESPDIQINTDNIRGVDQKKPLPFALKTNLLYDAALLPNLSVEVPLAEDWSLVVNGAFSKWDTKSPRYWSHQVNYGGLELRHWWNSDEEPVPLNGWFGGAYFTGGVYDLRLFTNSLDDYGYLSHWSWSAGLTGGYSMPLSARMNLEFSLNAGYLAGEYHAYNRSRCKDCYPERKRGRVSYWGPTGAGVTLVYKFGMKNY